MAFWRQLTRGLRALTARGATDGDIAEEVQQYLDEATASHVARGLPPDEALRTARRELGYPASVREEVRSYGWENVLEDLITDLRHASRRLRADTGFTTTAVLTLAIGIGATTAIFSVANPVLLRPIPYPAAGRIVMLWELGRDGHRNDGTFGMFRALADRAHSFEALAVLKPWQPSLTGKAVPERLEGQRVSAGYFTVLGIHPALGATFQERDDVPNGPNVVVLSDRLWRRRFQADPTIVGRQITLDDDPYLVVAVMPKDFENVLAPSAELWAPLQYGMDQGRAWGHHLATVGRLRPPVQPAAASAELDVLGRAVLNELHPVTYGSELRFSIVPLHAEVTREVKPVLLALLGAVGLVLLIACVNVTNLLLARDARRQGEFALRSALGAGRSRLVRQLVAESLLLAGLGGTAGMGLALLGVRLLVMLSPADLPRVGTIAADGWVFLFGVGLTTLVGLACGLVPARHAAKSDPQEALQRVAVRTTGGSRRTRNALVVAEVALALTLLVSAGLLLQSLQRLLRVQPGFEPSHLLTMQVQTVGHRFDADSTTYRFFSQALEAVRGAPGVVSAALTNQVPLSGDADLYGVTFDPPVPDDPGEARGTFRYAVSPDYFRTMGIPLRQGRLLEPGDDAGAPRVAVVSEGLVRRLGGADPIGHQVHIGSGPLYTIVGVVGNVHQQSLALNEADAVYVTPTQWRFADNVMSLVVRTRGDPAALAGPMRAAIWSVDKDQPIARSITMDQLITASTAERRFALIMFEAFGLAALLLAAAGIYGIVSGSVAERTREIGVRAALGASRASILGFVVRQGLALVAVGVVIGTGAATVTTEAISSQLFGVSPLDPATYLAMVILLVAVAMAACAVPAWRAVRVDPASALRLG